MNRVPVVALTGHLGAGKTSLLNHLLRARGARLGVIVNDFGTINVDAALVSGQVDDVAGIAGGCICCLDDAGGLDDALERLAQERLRLDAILIEASGAADPLVLARLIRYSGVDRVRPGGIIDVVDAVEYFDTVDTRPEPPARFAASTLVVIGKTDLLAPGERDAVIGRIRARIAERNPRVPVILARRGGIDPALVFDTVTEEDPPDQLPIARLVRESAAHGDGDHHHHEHARAASVALAAPTAPSALIDLLERPPAGTYRLKGRVRVRAPRGDRGFVVNLVGRMIHVSALPEPPAHGELVAIGADLDVDTAHRDLQRVAESDTGGAEAAGLRRLHRYRRLSD